VSNVTIIWTSVFYVEDKVKVCVLLTAHHDTAFKHLPLNRQILPRHSTLHVPYHVLVDISYLWKKDKRCDIQVRLQCICGRWSSIL